MASHSLTINSIKYECSNSGSGWDSNDYAVKVGHYDSDSSTKHNHYTSQMVITTNSKRSNAQLQIKIKLDGDCRPRTVGAYFTSTQINNPNSVYTTATTAGTTVYPTTDTGGSNGVPAGWVSSSGNVGKTGDIYYTWTGITLEPNKSYYVYFYDTETDQTTINNAYKNNTTKKLPKNGSIDGSSIKTTATNTTATATVPEYTVTVTNGKITGIGNANGTYDHGTTLGITANNASTGHYFSKWSGDSISTSKSITVTVDGDKKYTANYSPYKLTVTYHGNGATLGEYRPDGPGTTDYSIENPGGVLKDPRDEDEETFITKELSYGVWDNYGLHNYTIENNTLYLARTGYQPTGIWGTSTTGGNTLSENTTGNGNELADKLGKSIKTGNASVTVYAQWVANTYTISYNSNGGTGGSTANTSCTYDSNVTIRSNGFERLGYKFVGWNTAADGSGTAYTENQSVTNLTTDNGETITLYAQWEALATMFVKVGSEYIAGIPYIKVDGGWKRAIGVYVKVDGKWKLSTR